MYQVNIINSQFIDYNITNKYGIIGVENKNTDFYLFSCEFSNIDTNESIAGIYAQGNCFKEKKLCFNKCTAVYNTDFTGASALYTKSTTNSIEFNSVYACTKEESWHGIYVENGSLVECNFSYADQMKMLGDTWSSAFCSYVMETVSNILVFHCDGGNSISVSWCELLKNIDFIECAPDSSIINSQSDCIFEECVFIKSTERITNYNARFTNCYFDQQYVTKMATFIGPSYIVSGLTGKNQPIGKEVCLMINFSCNKFSKISLLVAMPLVNIALFYFYYIFFSITICIL